MNKSYWKAMNIFPWLFFGGCICVHANTYSQSIKFSKKGNTIKDIISAVQTQSNYRIIVDKALLNSREIRFDNQQGDLKQVLNHVKRNTDLDYRIESNSIFLFKQKENRAVSVTTSFNATKENADQQYITLKGEVVNENGQPMQGVVISLVGHAAKSVTNAKGEFNIIIVSKGTSTLLFSYMGMEKLEQKVNSNAPIRVTMKAQTSVLDEMVVTGYQTLRRNETVGSYSTIKAKELAITGFNTLEQALQGRLPGVVIMNESGEVGVRQRTRVRGTSSLVGSQDPIWVVDGVIQEDPLPFKTQGLDLNNASSKDNFDFIRNYVGNSIAWLNPMDIEDITVLKDAVATAIYGIRAANGVIVITTKKGSGNGTINYNYGLNLSERVNYDRLDMMNSKDRIAVSREIFDRGLVAPSLYNGTIGYTGLLKSYLDKQLSEEDFQLQVKQLEMQNTNWFDILFRTPLSQNHNLSFSGGSEKMRVYTSVGHNRTLGTAIGNGSQTSRGTANLSMVLNPKLNITSRISGAYTKTNGFYLIDPYQYATRINRIIPAYEADGRPYFYRERNGYLFSILNERDQTGNENRNTQVNAVLNVNYNITKNIRFNSLLSYGVTSTIGEAYATERTMYVADRFRKYDYGTVKPNTAAYLGSKLPVGGIFNVTDMQATAVNWRNSINYTKTLAEKHALVFMLGQELSSTIQKGSNGTNLGYLHDRGRSFAQIPLSITSGTTVIPNDYNQQVVRSIIDRQVNTLGHYLTGSYTYNNRYAVNVSVRSDASNRFGQFTNQRFNPVWATGFRWNVAQEAWFNKINWMTQLSLRGTYGYQRNIAANVGPDLILKIPTGTGASSVDVFTGENLLEISSLPYGNLRWEKNQTYNLGMDMSILENRVALTLDYYQKRGRDLLTTLNIPLEYGMKEMIVNGGSMDNKGLELSLSFTPIRKTDYNLSVSFNTAKNFNTIKRTGIMNRNWQEATSGSYYKEGYPVGGFWAFDFQGIDPINGYPIIGLETSPGSDPTVDPTAYMKYMGSKNPDLTAGLNLNFRYKQLALSTSFYMQLGGKRFLAPAYPMSLALPSEYENLSNELLSRWTLDNPDAQFPGIPDTRVLAVRLPDNKTPRNNVYEMYNYSTARVVNGSMLRMNNLGLNYFLQSDLLKRVKAQNASISLMVTNPLTWVSSDFKGRDPEVAQGAQPRLRTYTLNFSVSF